MNRMYLHSMAMMAMTIGHAHAEADDADPAAEHDPFADINMVDHIERPRSRKPRKATAAPLDDHRPAPKEKSRSLKRMLRRRARA